MSRTRLIVSAILIVIIGMIAVPASWAGGLKTGTPVSLAATAGGDAVLLVDLNNDAKQDLVVAECNLGQIEIFQGDGLGGFTLKKTIAIGLVCPQALAAGLLTNATFPDIVVGDTGGNVTVIPNDGSMTFPTAPVVTNLSGSANVTGLAVADIDGDGIQDVVASSGEIAGKVYILLGNGLVAWVGTPTAGSPYSVGSFPKAVAVADFNGDGEPDIATPNFGDNTVSILTNNTPSWPLNPAVTFSAATPSSVATGPVAIAAGVVGNTTPKPDLVVAARSGTKVSVLLNNGSGAFPATSTDTTVSGAPTAIALGNFSTHLATPFNDIIVSAADGADILFNNGSGVFAGPSVNFAITGGSNPAGIAVNKINGDNWVDVAVVNNTVDTVSIFLGTPFSAVTPLAVTGPCVLPLVASSVCEGVALPNPTTLLTFKYDNPGSHPASEFVNATTQVNNWGDGASSAMNVTGPDVNDVYTAEDTVTHTYAEQGTFNISLTIDNSTDGQSYVITPTSTPPSATATVNDAPLCAQSPACTPPVVNNNLPDAAPPHTYTNVTVANFGDFNPGAASSDFSASIDWGDCGAGGAPHGGAPGTCAPGNLVPGTVSGPVAGVFTVQGTSPAALSTIGVYTIVTTITDTEGGSTQTTTVTITANITTITSIIAAAGTPATEGVSLTNQVVATFISSNNHFPASYTAKIDWDDCGPNNSPGACPSGSQTTGTITPVSGSKCGGSGCTVSGTHTYSYGAAAGTPFHVVVYVTDTTDNSVANDAAAPMTITVSDATLTAAVAQPANIPINEGSVLTGLQTVANFKDNNPLAVAGDFTGVTVTWHDSNNTSSSGSVTGGPTNFSITATPQVNTLYTEKANVTITFSVTDSGGGLVGNTLTNQNGAVVQVNDAPLTAPTNAPISIGSVGTPLKLGVDNYNGSLGSFTDGNGSAPLNDFDNPSGGGALNTAGSFVDWGDGLANRENCTSNAGLTPHCVIGGAAPNFTVAGSHTFQAAGTLAVVVHIIDVDGSTGTINNITAHVSSISSTTPVTNVPVVEGTNMSPDLVATFVSQRPNAAAADFNAAGTSINWGDGVTDNAPSANITILQTVPVLPTPCTTPPCTFEVHGTHAFANLLVPAPLTRNITVTVKDSKDLSTATINSTAVESDGTVSGVAPAVSPLPATEGVKIAANTKIGRFLDSNPNAAAGDYSEVVVNWNDPNNAGVQSKLSLGQITLVPVGGSPGEFDIEVAGTNGYQYREVSNPTVTFVVSEKGGFVSATLNGVIFNVADNKPLVGGAPLQIDKNNGGGTPLVVGIDNFTGNNGKVASFTDPNPFALTNDFNISIDWGDGTPADVCNAPCANITQPGGVGTVFNVSPGGGHIFQKAGSQLTAVIVTITDKSDLTNTINVNDGVAIVTSISSTTPVLNTPVTEGVNNPALLVGTFVSQRATAAAVDFNGVATTINWGDGSPVDTGIGGNITIVQNPVGPCPCTFEVHGTHAFATILTPGPVTRNITISVKDSVDNSTAGINSTASETDATIAQVPPVIPVVPATEGVAIPANTVLGRFQDGNPKALATDYTDVVVHWNDPNNPGTTSSLSAGQLTLVPVSPGVFDIAVVGANGYQYREVSNPGVTFDVTDKGGAPPLLLAIGVVFNVADAKPLVGGAPLQIDKNNGGGTHLLALVDNFTGNNGKVATFTDPNPFALTNDFNISINWGDGVTDTCNAPCANITQPGGAGTVFNVSPGAGHIFQKAGSQLTPVIVTITDKSDLANTISVNDGVALVTSLTAPVSANIAPVEGVAFSGAVGQFTSTTGNLNFSASINWGDTHINSANSITGGPPTWTVNGSNTYADEDPITCGAGCAITITVTDNTDGSTLTISGGKANVLDAPLTVVPVPGLIAQAGQALNNVVVGQFQDGNSLATIADFIGLTVHWNDPNNPGSPTAGVISQVGPGVFQITASYPSGYSINGNYQVTFDIADIGAARCVVANACVITGGAGVSITNSPGILTGAGKTLQPASGTLTGIIATFANTNPSLPVTDYTGTVDWGDGTPAQACSSTSPTCLFQQVGPGNFSVTGSHTYLQLGQTYPITIVVNDAVGGATVTIHSTAAIPNVVLTDFLGGASPPQSQIQAGQAIDILVTLSPNPATGPFGGPVVFTGCTILSGPATTGLTCAFNPTQVPNVLQVYQVHVTVQSFASVAMDTAPAKPGSNRQLQLALLLPAFVGTFGVVLLGSKKNRRRTLLWWVGSLLLLAILLVGCGGGANLATPKTGAAGTVPGTYLVQMNTNAGSAVGPCAVNGTGPCITSLVTITK